MDRGDRGGANRRIGNSSDSHSDLLHTFRIDDSYFGGGGSIDGLQVGLQLGGRR